ncbi:MAG: putative PLP-dependent aminotransferase [Methylobacter sp.]|jgi:putative PLP-dependent aminotransferase (TIGR04422 family)
MEKYFLWPESSALQALVSAPRLVSVATVEGALRDMFPTGHPVLCSSGRAALALALIQSEVSRRDLVGVFPYASHCVLDTVSRIATPLTGAAATTASLRLVYHQWGFVQETNLPPNAIEDCVDTLCLPGTALFPGGGRFEIWSLPKILGTSSGGVLWCRDEEAAETVRRLRVQRGGGLLPWVVRLLAKHYSNAHLYWQGAEGDMGQVSRWQTGEILAAILNWETLVSDRLKKMNMVWPYAVDWLQKPVERLSPVVPMPLELPEELVYELGISSGYRMFERLSSSGSRSLEKVLPVPIHQDVSVSWLEEVVNRFADQKRG